MSVTFYIASPDAAGNFCFIDGAETLNLCNRNAADLVAALGLSLADGILAPVELGLVMDRCVRYRRQHLDRPDPGLQGYEAIGSSRAQLIVPDREPGYLVSRVVRLQELIRSGLAIGATHLYGA